MITNSEIECFLREVQGFIEQNKYIIKSTDKNDLLLEDYILSESERKNILLSLNVDDFYRKDVNYNPGHSGYVYKFLKRVELLHRYENEIKHIKLYIKFSYPIEGRVVVISCYE